MNKETLEQPTKMAKFSLNTKNVILCEEINHILSPIESISLASLINAEVEGLNLKYEDIQRRTILQAIQNTSLEEDFKLEYLCKFISYLFPNKYSFTPNFN